MNAGVWRKFFKNRIPFNVHSEGEKLVILLPIQNSQVIANFFSLIKYDLEQVICPLFDMTSL